MGLRLEMVYLLYWLEGNASNVGVGGGYIFILVSTTDIQVVH